MRPPLRRKERVIEITSAAAVAPAVELTEEERIESAKYLPRKGAPRLFEEEQFVFPETYGKSRVRLLVKDPEWLFAYWDVPQPSLATLRREMGERVAALSRLTLRVESDQGGPSVILLPPSARAWYVRGSAGAVTYRALIGLTLPSGEFRPLAESNPVQPPRSGVSPTRAERTANYRELAGGAPPPGPPADSHAAAEPASGAKSDPIVENRGGASDVYHRRSPGDRGVPDRGGASDRFRR